VRSSKCHIYSHTYSHTQYTILSNCCVCTLCLLSVCCLPAWLSAWLSAGCVSAVWHFLHVDFSLYTVQLITRAGSRWPSSSKMTSPSNSCPSGLRSTSRVTLPPCPQVGCLHAIPTRYTYTYTLYLHAVPTRRLDVLTARVQ
jgi:hypothetical protein